MAKYKIEQDHEGCIGCGSCAALAPEVWEMTEGGKAKVKPGMEEFEEEKLKENKDAAESCPVNVIHIKDDKGNQLV